MNCPGDSHLALHICNHCHCWGRFIQTEIFHITRGVREGERFIIHFCITMRRQLQNLESEKVEPRARRVCQGLAGFGVLDPSLHAPEFFRLIFNLTPHFQLLPKMKYHFKESNSEGQNGNLSWVRVRVG